MDAEADKRRTDMSRGIIIYQSKYGSTEKYARWLAEATGFDIIEAKKAKTDTINGYDTVVLCGAVYASGIAGISYLRKHSAALAGKRGGGVLRRGFSA